MISLNFDLDEYFNNFDFNFSYVCPECMHIHQGFDFLKLKRSRDNLNLRCFCGEYIDIYRLIYSAVPNKKVMYSMLTLYIYNYLASDDNNYDYSFDNFWKYIERVKHVLEFIISDDNNLLYDLINLKNIDNFDQCCEMYLGMNYDEEQFPDKPKWSKNHQLEEDHPFKLIKDLSDAICWGMIKFDHEFSLGYVDSDCSESEEC